MQLLCLQHDQMSLTKHRCTSILYFHPRALRAKGFKYILVENDSKVNDATKDTDAFQVKMERRISMVYEKIRINVISYTAKKRNTKTMKV